MDYVPGCPSRGNSHYRQRQTLHFQNAFRRVPGRTIRLHTHLQITGLVVCQRSTSCAVVIGTTDSDGRNSRPGERTVGHDCAQVQGADQSKAKAFPHVSCLESSRMRVVVHAATGLGVNTRRYLVDEQRRAQSVRRGSVHAILSRKDDEGNRARGTSLDHIRVLSLAYRLSNSARRTKLGGAHPLSVSKRE